MELSWLFMRSLLIGLASLVPSVYTLIHHSTGGTVSARYCYSVWLRHLVLMGKNSLMVEPKVIAELGPGDSFGIGLAALLSGANTYYAFDIVEYASNQRNLQVLNDLVELFLQRAAIPGDDEFPEVKPKLNSYDFPAHILTEQRLKKTLAPQRIEAVRRSLVTLENEEDGRPQIRYVVPWHDPQAIRAGTVDCIFSQAVLEHVDDLESAYRAFFQWLRPEGVLSHQIDFRSHRTSQYWNGHWGYSDFAWKLIRAKRPYLVNRQPYSVHERLLAEVGFDVVDSLIVHDDSGLPRDRLAPAFRQVTASDLVTSGAYILATKKSS